MLHLCEVKKIKIMKHQWEVSTGISDYVEIVNGTTVTKSTFSRRMALNTDLLKNRESNFGKGMKKAFIRISLGKHPKTINKLA